MQRIATGGEGVATHPDGRTLFVRGGLPGETVLVEIETEKKRFVRGHAIAVETASPERTEVACRHVADGCGGCDWMHASATSQTEMKEQIVTDVLGRIGGFEDPSVTTLPLAPSPEAVGAGRTTVRCSVTDGRAGYRRRRSHDGLIVETCTAAHPLVEEVLVESNFGDVREVTIRAGVHTGERLVVVSPAVDQVEISVPDDVLVVGRDELRRGRRAWYHEEVAGHRWRISARSFFQTRPDGAERLVEAVGAIIDTVDVDGPLVDLYSGVGLFAGTVANGRAVTAVETSQSSVSDAKVNVPDARIVRAKVENWKPSRAAAVVADPSRSGLGPAGVEKVVATGAGTVALVSCDAGSLGRDAGLLRSEGFDLLSATVVDMFPDTSHVEVVSHFRHSRA